MKVLIGILLTIALIGVGGYFDISVLFVGGIEQAGNAFSATPKDWGTVAWGVFRVCCSGAGLVVAFILAFIGWTAALAKS